MTPRQLDATCCHLHHRLPGLFLRWWSARFSALLPVTYTGFFALLTLLCLSGCGPGTGGTGTGPIVATSPAVISFSGTASPAASQPVLPTEGAPGPVAQPLPGSAGGSPSVPLLPAGSALVPEFCVVSCSGAGVRLLIDAQQIQLLERCARFSSIGPLELAAAGETAVAGTFESSRNNTTEIRTVSALLIVEFSDGIIGSPKVKVRVVDNAGVLLLGPLNLMRDSAEPNPSNSTLFTSCSG